MSPTPKERADQSQSASSNGGQPVSLPHTGREVVSEKTQHRLVRWSRGTRNYLFSTTFCFLHIFHSGFLTGTVRLTLRFIFLVSQLCKTCLACSFELARDKRCNTRSHGDGSEFIRLIFYGCWRKNRTEIPSLRVFLGCHTIAYESMFPSLMSWPVPLN